MKRLILTNDSSAAGHLLAARIGDYRIALERQLIWGQLLSDAELSGYFGARKKRQKQHWLDYAPQWRLERIEATGLGLVELCSRFDTIELWMDPRPNDQLQLICLLHYLRAHPEIASRLSLVQAHVPMGGLNAGMVAQWKLPSVKISQDHFELASRAWRAFGAATPQDWFGLLATDLSLLPRLRHAVTILLEELPWRRSGLGATEMRMLHFTLRDEATPRNFFRCEVSDSRQVFGYWELGALLDRLGRCRKPAVSGIIDGPFTLEMHDERARHRRYMKSKLALTPIGYGILGQVDDFARHNQISRWWGGTKLTNKKLWRWDQDNKELVAP
jgi:hypothetical protein